MPTRNIKSYIAVVAAAAPAVASASDGSVRALAGASGEGVLWAIPTVYGGEVLGDF
ncbi:MAG TPA: hypothetical protein VGJ54_02625 [Streptosporangiaceae bacterium]